MHKALFYNQAENKKVECNLCRHRCIIKEGRRGICNVRENNGGELYSVFYGKPCSLAVDPIEKKPLYHFLPGSRSFSIACFGCNFRCLFCQNAEISQYGREKNEFEKLRKFEDSIRETPPEEIVKHAEENSCASISYTYTEPTVFYEYAKDIALLARAKGLKNVFVTNGFMSREVIEDCTEFLDAANVDLKAFNKDTYKKIIGGDLSGVLDSIALLKKKNVWIEITTLVVPGMNDSKEELSDIARFIASIDKDIPWHLSPFYPRYKMDKIPQTPISSLELAYNAGVEAGLRYVYRR